MRTLLNDSHDSDLVSVQWRVCYPGFGFPVQKTVADGLFFNVGVYGLPNHGAPFDPVDLNSALENRATALGGRKMLYAQSFYSESAFWALFNRSAYERVRRAYGGEGVFPDIATKLLLGPKRLDAMRGKQPVSFAPVLWPMAAWYASLWMEMFTPRFLHSWFGIEHTGMTVCDPHQGDLSADTGAPAPAPVLPNAESRSAKTGPSPRRRK
jgi:hypothetical protein